MHKLYNILIHEKKIRITNQRIHFVSNEWTRKKVEKKHKKVRMDHLK